MKLRKFNLFPVILILLGLTLSLYIWGLQNPKVFIFSYSPSGHLVIKKNTPPPVSNKINLLFLGVAGDGSRGSLLTDTIFVIHLDPTTKNIVLISLPRDLWVQIPHSLRYTKINSIYELENPGRKFANARSFNLIQAKIEQILGEKIDYVVIFDLVGFGKLVDALGGLDIYLEKTIIDPNLVNPHNPHEIFRLEAGWRHLDGKTAIKFVRTRYNPAGDFYRIKHQQQIIATLKDKIVNIGPSWSLRDWLRLWKELSGHFITNLDFDTLWQLFQSLKSIPSDQITYLSITNRDPDNLLCTSSVDIVDDKGRKKPVYILIPRAGIENYSQIQAYIQSHLRK